MLAVVGARSLAGRPYEHVVVAHSLVIPVRIQDGAHDDLGADRPSGGVNEIGRGRVDARIEIRGVLGPDDDVKAAATRIVRQLLGGLSMVAGDLHGPTEGVLDIVGNVSLDGAHLQAAFLGDAVNGQCQREDESEAGAGDGGESVEDSPGPHRPDDFGQAGADERHQKCQADGARVGGEGQEGGIGHGECETTEGEPAPWPARAQLLHAAPQHGEGDDSCCDRMPGSGSDVGQGGHPAHQRPCCAQDDHVEGLDKGERRPADRVSHGDSSEVQQGSEEGEPENEA